MPAARMWAEKYQLRDTMLPSFIPPAVAAQVTSCRLLQNHRENSSHLVGLPTDSSRVVCAQACTTEIALYGPSQVLLTGKGINFLRSCCPGSEEWVRSFRPAALLAGPAHPQLPDASSSSKAIARKFGFEVRRPTDATQCVDLTMHLRAC